MICLRDGSRFVANFGSRVLAVMAEACPPPVWPRHKRGFCVSALPSTTACPVNHFAPAGKMVSRRCHCDARVTLSPSLPRHTRVTVTHA
jgi:hypothetical protein